MSNLYKIFRGTGDNNTNVTGIFSSSISGDLDLTNLLGNSAASPDGNVLSKRYDEPTYMTFRVLFGQNAANISGTTLLNTDYDRMPHPLFINQKVDVTQIQGAEGKNVVEFNRNFYSTRDYLRDCNEFTRAEMLNEFITLWVNLQDNFQWYFQSIEGISDLLTIVPERGQRVGRDVRLTFNMLEGIDHRISYLLNLYKKIAWDDVYQRWVLPDLMKFFDIQILITEFRTFHKSTAKPNSDAPVYLQILDNILPTYLIECQMCEFDINSFSYSYRDTISVSEDPQMASVSFKVKVGNVNEISTYPLFAHFIMNDYKLNGMDRSKEKGSSRMPTGKIKNEIASSSLNNNEPDYISTKDGDLRYSSLDKKAQDTYFQDNHTSCLPFNESNPYDNIRNSSNVYSIDLGIVNPAEPATWVGNALKFGKSFAVNFVTQKVDKAKMTNIPGLGFSFNDAIAAIESKDFNSVLALIRRAITESIGTTGPSGALGNKIDSTFKQFLIGLTMSEATDGDELEFIRAANQALNDKNTWNLLKDLSRATNLKSAREINIPVIIEGKNIYKQSNTTNIKSATTNISSNKVKIPYIKEKDKSKATSSNNKIVIESTPTSNK